MSVSFPQPDPLRGDTEPGADFDNAERQRLRTEIGPRIKQIRALLQGVNPYVRLFRSLLRFDELGFIKHSLETDQLQKQILDFADGLTELDCTPDKKDFFRFKAEMLRGYVAEIRAITSSPNGLNRPYDQIAASILQQLEYIENLGPMTARAPGWSPNTTTDPATPPPVDGWLN